LLALPAGAQSSTKGSKGTAILSGQSSQSGTIDAQDSGDNTVPIDSTRREMREKMVLELRKQRYAQVVANTEELLRLATELNAEVGASGSGTLTGDQLRKVARIEKLARSVKEGMARPIPMDPQLPGNNPVITLP
jgi:hypothetical protein